MTAYVLFVLCSSHFLFWKWHSLLFGTAKEKKAMISEVGLYERACSYTKVSISNTGNPSTWEVGKGGHPELHNKFGVSLVFIWLCAKEKGSNFAHLSLHSFWKSLHSIVVYLLILSILACITHTEWFLKLQMFRFIEQDLWLLIDAQST